MDEYILNDGVSPAAPTVGDVLPKENSADIVAPSPPSHRRFVFLVGALAGGNFVATLFRIAGGALQARLVAPDLLGLFISLGFVQGYLRFVQLGVVNGLSRELPYWIGRGETQRVRELAATAQAWAICCGVFASAVFCGFAISSWMAGNHWMTAGWSAYAVTAFLFFYSDSYTQATYRTSSDFARLSAANVVQSFMTLILLVLVIYLGFYGLCLRAVLSALAGFWLLQLWRPIRVRPQLKVEHVKHLLAIGFPIFVVGEMFNWWRLWEGTLVFFYLGKFGVGLWQMMLVVDASADLVPAAVGQVIYPRMAEHYGRHHDVWALFQMSHKPTLACAAGMLPLIILGWFLAAPLTHWIAPNYVGAIEAMKWGLVASYVFSFSMVITIFNVIRRQEIYGVIIAISMGVYFIALTYLTRGGATLVAFAQAMIIGRVVFVVLGYLGVLYVLRGAKATP